MSVAVRRRKNSVHGIGATSAHPGIKGDTAYLRILLLAASNLKSDVEIALTLLMEQGKIPTADDVKDIIEPHQKPQIPDMPELRVDLKSDDQLLTGTL